MLLDVVVVMLFVVVVDDVVVVKQNKIPSAVPIEVCIAL